MGSDLAEKAEACAQLWGTPVLSGLCAIGDVHAHVQALRQFPSERSCSSLCMTPDAFLFFHVWDVPWYNSFCTQGADVSVTLSLTDMVSIPFLAEHSEGASPPWVQHRHGLQPMHVCCHISESCIGVTSPAFTDTATSQPARHPANRRYKESNDTAGLLCSVAMAITVIGYYQYKRMVGLNNNTGPGAVQPTLTRVITPGAEEHPSPVVTVTGETLVREVRKRYKLPQ